MSGSKPFVFLTRSDYPNTCIKLLEECFTIKSWPLDTCIPKKSFLENIEGAFGILCAHETKIDAEVVEVAGPSLKIVSTFSVGYDHINVSEVREKGIRIGNTPGVLTEATAELAVSLLLATGRRFNESYKIVHNNLWTADSWRPFYMCGQGLDGATVGIIGCGRIGLSIAKKLKPFNIKRLLYSGRSEKAEAVALGGERKSVDDIMKESDFIVVAIALNNDTYRIINRERINFMKPNAIIVNIGRGGLIDQVALTEALLSKKIGGAGLDVTDPEPIEKDDPLLSMDNVVITPHIGSATRASRIAMAEVAARNILAVFKGEDMIAEVK